MQQTDPSVKGFFPYANRLISYALRQEGRLQNIPMFQVLKRKAPDKCRSQSLFSSA